MHGSSNFLYVSFYVHFLGNTFLQFYKRAQFTTNVN